MRARWDVRTLEELCNFKNGLWKGKTGPFIEAGVIRNTNFTKDGRLDDSDIAYLEVEKKQFETRQLEYGDLILEKSGGGPKQPVGRVILFNKRDGDFSFSNFTSIIRIKERDRIYFRFLHWYLHFLYLSGATEPMQKHSTNIRNLQLKEYKKIQVPLPGKTEQKRIVAILDEAFAGIETAIANTAKNLANSRELFESYLNDIFNPEQSDWPVLDLSEIAKVKGGKRVPKGYKLQTTPTAYPYIAVSDFDDYGSVNVDEVKYVTKEVHDQIKRYTITSSDVYISIAGTIGKSGIVPIELSGANLTENACKLELTGDASKRFVYLFTRTRLFMDQAVKNTRTTAQPKLALSRLKTIRLPLPPLEVQTKIVNAVDELRDETQRLEDIFKKKLSALAELKQSLLQKAFSGELTADRAEREVESVTG